MLSEVLLALWTADSEIEGFAVLPAFSLAQVSKTTFETDSGFGFALHP